MRGLLAICAVFAAPAAAEVCAEPPFDAPAEIARRVAQLTPVFAPYPAAEAALHGVSELCLTGPMIDARGYFEADTDRLVLDDTLPDGLFLAVFVHELRHAEQDQRGVCPAPDLAMAEHARAVMAMEADASVTSLVVAHDLRAEGDPAMWEALAGWPMQADIAIAFDRALDSSGDLAAAASAAFDQWYASDARYRAYYVAACSDYLDEAERSHRLPSYRALPGDFYDRLCTLPDGAAYACGP